jgi:hypothetical protein
MDWNALIGGLIGAGIPGTLTYLGLRRGRQSADADWLSAGLSLAKVAAYLGDTKEVVLATYAHFLPDDDDRARQIMNGFFKAAGSASSALDVPSEATE